MVEGFNATQRELEILELRKEVSALKTNVEYWRLAAERRDARKDLTGLDVAEARTLDAPEAPQCEVQSDVVAFINRRLEDLAEANALYGKDQRLGAPDKIARNEREISWLKDLRSMIALAAAQASGDCDKLVRVFAVTNLTEQKDVEFFITQWRDCADFEERKRLVRSFRNQMINAGAGEALSLPSASRGTEA